VVKLLVTVNDNTGSTSTADLPYSRGKSGQQPFHGHFTGQPAIADTSVKSWRILPKQFYCPHAIAGGSLHIRTGKKTPVLLNGIVYTVSMVKN